MSACIVTTILVHNASSAEKVFVNTSHNNIIHKMDTIEQYNKIQEYMLYCNKFPRVCVNIDYEMCSHDWVGRSIHSVQIKALSIGS